MGFFKEKCKECKSTVDVQMCQYCRKMVCAACLKRLVYKETTPKWFAGKKVKDFNEYKELNKKYCKLLRDKGVKVHCCEQYLKKAWSIILKQVKKLEEDRHQVAGKIILK